MAKSSPVGYFHQIRSLPFRQVIFPKNIVKPLYLFDVLIHYWDELFTNQCDNNEFWDLFQIWNIWGQKLTMTLINKMFGMIKILFVFLEDVFVLKWLFSWTFQMFWAKIWFWNMDLESCALVCVHVLTLCFIEMSLSNFKASELVVSVRVCVCVCVRDCVACVFENR